MGFHGPRDVDRNKWPSTRQNAHCRWESNERLIIRDRIQVTNKDEIYFMKVIREIFALHNCYLSTICWYREESPNAGELSKTRCSNYPCAWFFFFFFCGIRAIQWHSSTPLQITAFIKNSMWSSPCQRRRHHPSYVCRVPSGCCANEEKETTERNSDVLAALHYSVKCEPSTSEHLHSKLCCCYLFFFIVVIHTIVIRWFFELLVVFSQAIRRIVRLSVSGDLLNRFTDNIGSGRDIG